MIESNVKDINKKFSIMSIVIFVATGVLGYFYIFLLSRNLYIAGGEESMIIKGEGAEFFLISGLGFLGEIGALILLTVVFYFIPLIANGLVMGFNLLGMLFLSGVGKKWKYTTAKVFFFFTIGIQTLTVVYYIFLISEAISYGWSAIVFFIMIAVTLYAVVMYIIYLTKIREQVVNNGGYVPQVR